MLHYGWSNNNNANDEHRFVPQILHRKWYFNSILWYFGRILYRAIHTVCNTHTFGAECICFFLNTLCAHRLFFQLSTISVSLSLSGEENGLAQLWCGEKWTLVGAKFWFRLIYSHFSGYVCVCANRILLYKPFAEHGSNLAPLERIITM